MLSRTSLLANVVAFATLALLMSGPPVKAQEAGGKAALMTPTEGVEQAPARFKVNMDTSQGMIVIDVHRDWAPNAADRFYNLVKRGFFNNARFYRVIPNF